MKSKSILQLAEDHETSHVTIRNEIKAGRLRSFKAGKSRRVSEEAEREWIELLERESAQKGFREPKSLKRGREARYERRQSLRGTVLAGSEA